MTDQKFLEAIYKVAEEMLDRRLKPDERKEMIRNFNDSEGSSFEKAKKAIELTTGEKVPEKFLLLESEGAINELANLVAELEATAEEWAETEDE